MARSATATAMLQGLRRSVEAARGDGAQARGPGPQGDASAVGTGWRDATLAAAHAVERVARDLEERCLRGSLPKEDLHGVDALWAVAGRLRASLAEPAAREALLLEAAAALDEALHNARGLEGGAAPAAHQEARRARSS